MMKAKQSGLFLVLFFLLIGTAWSQQINQTDAKGKKQGMWDVKYPNSQVSKYKGTYKDGKPQGEFIHFYESGKVK
ncbi:MAG TPA: hypothetical protein PK637_06835, partial [Flavobacteriales bacterium]|nr:hypothetical protein [Flavobacteriales bacterium]